MKIKVADAAGSTPALAGKHTLCGGCGWASAINAVSLACQKAGKEPIFFIATGCGQVSLRWEEHTAFRASAAHGLFEDFASMAEGFQAVYAANDQAGYLTPSEQDRIMVALGGDGANEIGYEWTRGAIRAGFKGVIICLDNGGYRNTKGQASASTPKGATTTTSVHGQPFHGSDLVQEYFRAGALFSAQAVFPLGRNLMDLANMMSEAIASAERGPAFVNVTTPCLMEDENTHAIIEAGVNCWATPLYTIHRDTEGQEHWKLRAQPKIKEFVPTGDEERDRLEFARLFRSQVEHWTGLQARYHHAGMTPALIDDLTEHFFNKRDYLTRMCKAFP